MIEDGVDEADIDALVADHQRRNSPEALALQQADEQPGAYLWESASNLLPSAGRAVRDTALGVVDLGRQAAKAPFQVASALIGDEPLSASSTDIGRTAANLVPGVIESFKDRYGSPEARALTVREDPIGMVSDMATIVAPVAQGGRAAIRGTGNIARRTAEKVYATQLAPEAPLRVMSRETQQRLGKVVPPTPAQTGLEYNVVPTPQGVARAQTPAILEEARLARQEMLRDLTGELKQALSRQAEIQRSNMPPALRQSWARRIQAEQIESAVRDLRDVKQQTQPIVDATFNEGFVNRFTPPDFKRLAEAVAKADEARRVTTPLQALANAIPRSVVTGLATGLFGGLPAGLIGAGVGYASKNPAIVGRTAIGLDRAGRAMERLPNMLAGYGIGAAALPMQTERQNPSLTPEQMALVEELMQREGR